MNKPGVLITFEGIDGSGKSTQANLLLKFLHKQGYKVVFLREPGGTRVSEQIRKILLDTKNAEMHNRTELLLYLAARAEVVDKVIIPAIADGQVIIADRFYDSTYAYQIYGRGLPERVVRLANSFAADKIKPDLTFLVDLPVITAQKRLQRERDRLESAAQSFHQRVRKGFLNLADKEPRRITILDGKQPRERLWSTVKEESLKLLRRRAIEP